MEIKEDGFLYEIESKEVVTEVFTGNKVLYPETNAIFSGTKEDAIAFGLIFKEESNF